MNVHWILRSGGSAVETTRKFLQEVWLTAGLKGLLVPLYSPEAVGAQPRLVLDRRQMAQADPFAPIMTTNSARLAADLARSHSSDRLGAVLRPCEARALLEMSRRDSFRLDNFLIVGVDCLGTYPMEDYLWRAEKRGGMELLTRDVLQFARQGGILAYRNRRACQMCASPIPQGIDLGIGVLGLPVREAILITARDAETAQRLRLSEITDGEAPAKMVDDRVKTRARLLERRSRAHEQLTRALPADLPTDVPGFMRHLKNCAPCRACLDACPIYAGELTPGDGVSLDAVRRWLAACSGCGMCEEVCPNHLPLAVVHGRISWDLSSEWTPC